jgi:hypothetical protein
MGEKAEMDVITEKIMGSVIRARSRLVGIGGCKQSL